MLETFGSADLLLKTTLVLLALGHASLALRYCPWQGRVHPRLLSAAPALELVCGVLVLLFSSHYLLFVWGSQLGPALPGLLLGLPLVYSGGHGLLGSVRSGERPLLPAMLLGVALVLLLIGDEQRIWTASLYRLQAVAMGHPDLLLEEADDLGGFVPPPGTRVIFQPNKYHIACGLLANPQAPRPQLPYSISCDDYFWGPAMASIDPKLTNLPVLPYLSQLWSEDASGQLSLASYDSSLSRSVVLDLQRLCPLTEQCAASKQAIAGLFGQPDWASLLALLDGAGWNARIVLEDLSPEVLEALLRVLDNDVRARLDKHLEVLLVAYAKAQAGSLALRDLNPKYSFWADRVPLFAKKENSAGQWQNLKTALSRLMLKELKLGQFSMLMPGVVLELEPRAEGGQRLVYHTAVGRQPAVALCLFVLPLMLLLVMLLALVWCCIRPRAAQV